ncbi:MAG: alpha-glucan family phosphorylase [Proteobacteria bacterium]|nr:alpha-glucan family phosphorylase [Pseudomonadota bacterium]MBU1715945.1 alpha-glucan family phosphorylase [Pseudomonadota bacterium]
MKYTHKSIIDQDNILRNMLSTNEMGRFFGVSQEVLNQVWGNLTSASGNSATYISMEIGADLDVFNPVKSKLQELGITGSTNHELESFCKLFLNGPEKIPNYGGGLGILAGDTLKSFADCRIPVMGISLLYHKGYFSQLVDSKLGQIIWAKEWQPAETPLIYLLKDPKDQNKPLEIQVPFYNEDDNIVLTSAKLWLKMEINADLDFFVPQILLDYDTDTSPDWIKEASQHLYDSSSEITKIIQRRMLGAGVIPAMEALGVTSRTIHLNEQHGVAVVLLQIMQELKNKLGDKFVALSKDKDIIEAADKVAKKIVYTIHTPVVAGHDRFPKTLYRAISHSLCQRILQLLAEDDTPSTYNFTNLAMRVNRATNSVSRLHKIVTQQQFPQHAAKITAITNGVHHLTWISDAKAELYDSFPELENWRNDPSVFTKATELIDNEKFHKYLEEAWKTDNQHLITYVNNMLLLHRNQMQETWIDPPNFLSHLAEQESSLESGVYTIGFARRFSTYKRADLIFENIEKLLEPIIENKWPVNFIFSGKAHPADEPGKTLIKGILDVQEEVYQKSNGLAKVVFVPGYDMKIAKMMVAGVHAWLNSPKRPLEASGTSGMKAALNAIPNISIMDGWWAEGYHEGQTGWKFGYENTLSKDTLSENPSSLLYDEDSASFYKIFPEILKTFYDPNTRREYLKKCIMNMALNCPIFNTHRMAAEYLKRYNLKLPSAVSKKMDKFHALYLSDDFNPTN